MRLASAPGHIGRLAAAGRARPGVVAAAQSFGLLRLYLLALKAAGVVLLRLGDLDNARDHLSKLAALDQRDQLGASALLDIIDPFPTFPLPEGEPHGYRSVFTRSTGRTLQRRGIFWITSACPTPRR